MSFINPNFKNIPKKEIVDESSKIENINVNFDNVKLKGEPRRQDIPNKEGNIVSLDTIIKNEEETEFEYLNLGNVAKLTGVPKIEEFNLSEIAKIQIKYFNTMGNSMSM